ncbi:hypothetical protein RRG08_009508 [Elysia crispata]|uniref:Uncharacterized protein n=1 Tax=Elysia crispata TaxID=231223 RepID=A0AAE1B3D1_9GAST|nr:hypothetical protein RRG08_009508 [Elysia crispata]
MLVEAPRNQALNSQRSIAVCTLRSNLTLPLFYIRIKRIIRDVVSSVPDTAPSIIYYRGQRKSLPMTSHVKLCRWLENPQRL